MGGVAKLDQEQDDDKVLLEDDVQQKDSEEEYNDDYEKNSEPVNEVQPVLKGSSNKQSSQSPPKPESQEK